jgi:hypothetical protein
MLTTANSHLFKESEKLLNGINIKKDKLLKLKILQEQKELMKVRSKKKKRTILGIF